MKLKDFLVFVKFRIAFSVAISSIVGYILSAKSINWEIFALFTGDFFLAGGSGALNQVQEWYLDAKMLRTRNRPIPKGILSVSAGLLISVLLILFGSFFLSFGEQKYLSVILGFTAVIIYNFIYTPMKKISPFAAFPGALIGAIPPMIGWVFAGSSLINPLNISLGSFFFIWQIPHFWLLLIAYEDDYKRAGFPVLTDLISPLQLSRISFAWIVALVFCSLLIVSLLDRFSFFSLFAVVSLGIYLLLRTSRMVSVIQPQRFYRFAFVNLNIFVLLVSIIFSFHKLLN